MTDANQRTRYITVKSLPDEKLLKHKDKIAFLETLIQCRGSTVDTFILKFNVDRIELEDYDNSHRDYFLPQEAFLHTYLKQVADAHEALHTKI